MDLATAKTGPSTSDNGAPIIYTLTIINNGPFDADGATNFAKINTTIRYQTLDLVTAKTLTSPASGSTFILCSG